MTLSSSFELGAGACSPIFIWHLFYLIWSKYLQIAALRLYVHGRDGIDGQLSPFISDWNYVIDGNVL